MYIRITHAINVLFLRVAILKKKSTKTICMPRLKAEQPRKYSLRCPMNQVLMETTWVVRNSVSDVNFSASCDIERTSLRRI